MSWLFQKSGTINHYKKEIHSGTQPVRVIHHMILFMFQNTNKEFFKVLLEEIEKQKVNKELKLIHGEEPISVGNGTYRTPRINAETRTIELHETFLSYLWSCTYSIFILYVETVGFPRCNKENGRVTHPISKDNIESANLLFEYAKYLIVDFKDWDKEKLPNPEIYLAEKRDFIEQTNCFYTEAVKFILCHEFTHLTLHVGQINEATIDSHFLEFEMEADNNAIELMKKGILFNAHQLAIENGIIIGLLSMFFFSAKTEGIRHPNAEDRLTNALEKLELKNNPFAWGLACIGLKLWDEQFNHHFEWNDELSHRDLYYDIIMQIKSRNQE